MDYYWTEIYGVTNRGAAINVMKYLHQSNTVFFNNTCVNECVLKQGCLIIKGRSEKFCEHQRAKPCLELLTWSKGQRGKK